MEDPDQDSVGSGTSIELSPENNRRNWISNSNYHRYEAC